MRDSVPSASIQAFVMYCVNGTSCSSLLIESNDSMIVDGAQPTLDTHIQWLFLIHRICMNSPVCGSMARCAPKISD